jgi:hypothetical protein
MTDKRPSGRLIVRPLERYPNAAIWGFPIDHKRLVANFEDSAPPNISPQEHEDLLEDHIIRVLWDLQTKCRQVWSAPTICTRQAYWKSSPTREKTITVLVRCTRREDMFLPPPEKVGELKKTFAAYGFTEEPGWFVAAD